MKTFNKYIIIIALLLTIVICFVLSYIFNTELILVEDDQDKYIYCNDRKYSYVQLNSCDNYMSTLIIKKQLDDTDRNYFDIISTGIIFGKKDIKDISWGINSYHLFFDSKDFGHFCYYFDNDEWIGRVFLDVKHTKEEFKKGNKKFYHFVGDRKNKDIITNINPYGYERLACQIPVENIPEYYINIFNDILSQYP